MNASATCFHGMWAVTTMSIFASVASASQIAFTNTTFLTAGVSNKPLTLANVQGQASFFGSQPTQQGSAVLLGHTASQGQLITAGQMMDAGISQQQFGIMLAVSQLEPVTLQQFSLAFYTPAGYFTAVYDGPSITLGPLGNGTELNGWLFEVSLTPREAFGFFSDPTNTLGLIIPPFSSGVDSSSIPLMTFYLVAAPAPGSLALFALAAICPIRRRRRCDFRY